MKTARNNPRFGRVAAVVVAITMLAAPAGGQVARADTAFPQTGYSIWGPFETYWKTAGGLAQFGLPLTKVYQAGKDYDAQWFERAVFTFNPNKPNAYKVELNLLGDEIATSRRGEAPFATARAGTDGQFFTQTGHNVSGKFLSYWQQNGGLPLYGYPISEPFMEQSKSDGKTYLVQYFERNRFELHPELAGTRYEVQLGLLGAELLTSAGGPAVVVGSSKPAFYPPAGVNVPPGGIVTPPNAGTPGPGTTTIPPAPALPATNRPVLFASDFSSPDLSAWLPQGAYNPPDAVAPAWRVNNGLLEQVGDASEEGTSTDALLVTNSSGYSDALLDTYAWSGGGEPFGLVARYTDSGYYAVKLYATAPNTSPKARLVKVTRTGGETVLAASSDWPGYKPSGWYRLTFSARGSELIVLIDGVQMLKANDSQLTRGSLGFYAYADGRAKFDNLRVTAP